MAAVPTAKQCQRFTRAARRNYSAKGQPFLKPQEQRKKVRKQGSQSVLSPVGNVHTPVDRRPIARVLRRLSHRNITLRPRNAKAEVFIALSPSFHGAGAVQK